MPTDVIRMKEAEVTKLVMAFLEQSGLYGSASALEWETGFVGFGIFPEDALPLRSMLLKGRWSDAAKFVRGLGLTEEETKKALFQISKQKYVELMCIFQELKNDLVDDLGNAIAVCFSELSACASDPQEHEQLRNLASLEKIQDDPLYKDWTPFASRRDCFMLVWEIVRKTFGNCLVRPQACHDRLVLLLAKGLLYESCESYCRDKVLSKSNADMSFTFGSLTTEPPLGGAICKIASEAVESGGKLEEYVLDCNLFSWLHTVPWISLARDFVCRPLKVEVERPAKPTMADGWAEVILGGMGRSPMSPVTAVKEKFWNERISKTLIVDAPEILKRAEEVVSRWEERRKICVVPPAANREPGNKDKKRSSGKLRRQKCVSTNTGLNPDVPWKQSDAVSGDVTVMASDSSVRENILEPLMTERSFAAIGYKPDENGQFHALRDGDGCGDGNVTKERMHFVAGTTTCCRNVNKTNKNFNMDEIGERSAECGEDLVKKWSEASYARERERPVGGMGDSQEIPLSCGLTDVKVTQPQVEGYSKNEESEASISNSLSKDLVCKGFRERKEYITKLLNSKEQLRENLLQILASKN